MSGAIQEATVRCVRYGSWGGGVGMGWLSAGHLQSPAPHSQIHFSHANRTLTSGATAMPSGTLFRMRWKSLETGKEVAIAEGRHPQEMAVFEGRCKAGSG
eukprot:818086-Prymnesium_polylepis.1